PWWARWRSEKRSPGRNPLYRLFDKLHPWAMTEIFLLGVLVSYTKIVDLATVEIGPSMYAFVGLIVTMIAADTAVDTHDVWERLRPSRTDALPAATEAHNWVGCHTCQLLCHLPASTDHHAAACPRCGSSLHRRKRDSLNRTAALLITAAMLYIPANVYPIMTFISLGSGEPSTIIGGVQELIAYNMWPLALIVFVASILVPMLKLISMTYLLLSVRYRSQWRLRDRTLIYRMNEFVGRWSMVDVFVVTMLAALVQFGSLAKILPGPGIIAFAGVVVLTMIAALTFDSRLIWDAAGANDERN
ncbi:MAG: paraquat-inducible protein A, partial [Rhodospirillales bacterium]|nr:paraquat-inducible protein A [Rhodospirillales bacterium]